MSSNEKICKIASNGSCGGHVTQFWNFGISLISREWLELETSNLAWRRRAVSSNGKQCKIASKGVMWGSRDPILEFLEPPNISRTVGARNFKFGKETDVGDF